MMSDYIERQLLLIGQFIDEYKQGVLNLNTFIQRIEALSSVIDSENFRNSVFPVILKMEEINAVTIEYESKLSTAEENVIELALRELEQAIQHFKK